MYFQYTSSILSIALTDKLLRVFVTLDHPPHFAVGHLGQVFTTVRSLHFVVAVVRLAPMDCRLGNVSFSELEGYLGLTSLRPFFPFFPFCALTLAVESARRTSLISRGSGVLPRDVEGRGDFARDVEGRGSGEMSRGPAGARGSSSGEESSLETATTSAGDL